MRKLVVCCDGTWNTADQEEGGLPCPTNVKKFHSALKDNETADHEPGQMKYYHHGDGTGDTMIEKLNGGCM